MAIPTIPTAANPSQGLPASVRQHLRQAALRRNLRTAAVLGLAVSGAALNTTWLAVTAGGTFLALSAWRYRQLRQSGAVIDDRS